VAEVEAVVQPDSIADDIWRESVALVSIHGQIIRSGRLTCQYRHGIPLSGPMNNWPGIWLGDPRSIADHPEMLARLLSDPEFSVILEARVGFTMHATGEYQTAQAALGEILAEIDASLADQTP
jgi:hypothetical protein